MFGSGSAEMDTGVLYGSLMEGTMECSADVRKRSVMCERSGGDADGIAGIP